MTKISELKSDRLLHKVRGRHSEPKVAHEAHEKVFFLPPLLTNVASLKELGLEETVETESTGWESLQAHQTTLPAHTGAHMTACSDC